jgi:hypothetical protein
VPRSVSNVACGRRGRGESGPKKIHRRRDADPQKGIAKYGKATFADPVNKKYPIDTPSRIKAAWAHIHQPRNAEVRRFTAPLDRVRKKKG